jgi:hypothetical protein
VDDTIIELAVMYDDPNFLKSSRVPSIDFNFNIPGTTFAPV